MSPELWRWALSFPTATRALFGLVTSEVHFKLIFFHGIYKLRRYKTKNVCEVHCSLKNAITVSVDCPEKHVTHNRMRDAIGFISL